MSTFKSILIRGGARCGFTASSVIAHTIASARSGLLPPAPCQPSAVNAASSSSSSGKAPANFALPVSNSTATGSARAALPSAAWTRVTGRAPSAPRNTSATIAPPLFCSATIRCAPQASAALATRRAQPFGESPPAEQSAST